MSPLGSNDNSIANFARAWRCEISDKFSTNVEQLPKRLPRHRKRLLVMTKFGLNVKARHDSTPPRTAP